MTKGQPPWLRHKRFTSAVMLAEGITSGAMATTRSSTAGINHAIDNPLRHERKREEWRMHTCPAALRGAGHDEVLRDGHLESAKEKLHRVHDLGDTLHHGEVHVLSGSRRVLDGIVPRAPSRRNVNDINLGGNDRERRSTRPTNPHQGKGHWGRRKRCPG